MNISTISILLKQKLLQSSDSKLKKVRAFYFLAVYIHCFIQYFNDRSLTPESRKHGHKETMSYSLYSFM